MSQDNSVSKVAVCRLDGIRSPAEATAFILAITFRPTLGHSNFVSNEDRGSLPGREATGASSFSLSSTEVKNEWNFASVLHIRLHGALLKHGDKFTFIIYIFISCKQYFIQNFKTCS
jgi:hypothetical protein